MKTLLLMRHAKSSWKDHSIEDHERGLNKRGKKDAPLMGKLLYDKELVPQLILSSDALRAHLTVDAIVKEMKYKGEVKFLHSFYRAEPDTFLDTLEDLPDDLERVMVLGHNPELEAFLQILTSRVESLSTAAIAHLVLPIKKWKQLDDDTEGELVELFRPRDLKEKHKK